MYNHTTIGGFYTMAKLTMKDYENFLEEEARQDRLQRDLEYQRYEESYDSEENWRDYKRRQEEERRCEEFNRYSEYDGYFDERDFFDDWEPEGEYDPDCYSNPYPDDDGFREFCSSAPEMEDHDLYALIDELSKSIFLEGYDGAYATSERLAKKSVARNRHLSKVKAEKSKAQKANYVAKREMRKCCKLYRNLDKAYWQLANKAYSDGYLPYSMCQNMERRVNANLDQMSDIVLKAHYFECILGAPMYKQALSAPKAM